MFNRYVTPTNIEVLPMSRMTQDIKNRARYSIKEYNNFPIRSLK